MKDGPTIVRHRSADRRPRTRRDAHGALAGQALTATELAGVAAITKQTASAHLAKLDAKLAGRVESQGRHRYFRLADRRRGAAPRKPHGGRVPGRRRCACARARASRRCARRASATTTSPATSAWSGSRRCGSAALVSSATAGCVTPRGRAVLRRTSASTSRRRARGTRALCRTCLDWSERRHHLAGVARRGIPRALLRARLGQASPEYAHRALHTGGGKGFPRAFRMKGVCSRQQRPN